MQNWQKRVIAEKEQLDERILGLSAFVSSDRLLHCVPDERTRLSRQLEIMREYSDILGRRIAEFPPAASPKPAEAEAEPEDGKKAGGGEPGEGQEAAAKDGGDEPKPNGRKSKKSAKPADQ